MSPPGFVMSGRLGEHPVSGAADYRHLLVQSGRRCRRHFRRRRNIASNPLYNVPAPKSNKKLQSPIHQTENCGHATTRQILY
jgi:hypothetical protein